MENKKLTWKHYLGIAVVAVLVIYLVIGFSFSNKFFWGTKINGMNVAGKTADQVIEMFDKKANDYSLTIKERKDKTETLTSDQLRTKFEGADEIKQIKEDQGSFGWIKGLFGSEHYDNVTMYSYDTKSFTKAYKKLDAFNNKKMIKIANAKPVYKDGKFEIQKEDYYAENGGVVFPNPNAPTGAFLSLEVVEDIIQHNQDVVVIVDEAYIDFGGDTAKELTRKYDNVLVVQTYSKSRSLAGLRIGYAIGNKELIKAMNDVKYSYNSYTMNEPSIVLGTAVLEDEEYFQETRNKIIDTREWFQIEMRKIGFSFADSKANFIFATHESVPAKEIFEAAKKAKIYVRYFDQPRINNYLRITIGTRDEMETLLDFLKEFTATK